jgi:hypothetical protein
MSVIVYDPMGMRLVAHEIGYALSSISNTPQLLPLSQFGMSLVLAYQLRRA